MFMPWQERVVVNSVFRDWFVPGEISAFRRMADLSPGQSVLDVGCGKGVLTRLIVEAFRPKRVVALDVDPREIELARRYLGSRVGDTIELHQADAMQLPFADGEFDAAFEISTLHHVADWRQALVEIARVLKPGGPLYFAEPSEGRIHRGWYCMMGHEKDAGFTREELFRAMSAAGLEPAGDGKMWLWDIVGLARKAA